MTFPRLFLAAFVLFAALARTLPDAAAQETTEEAAPADGGAGGEGEASPRVPRFVSLGSSEINVRTGPGSQYPIAWKYVRSGLPVEIVAEFEFWRKIKDHDGSVGWVHKSLLSGKRFASVEGLVRVMYDDPVETARPLLRLEPGVIVRLERCRGDWCRVNVEGSRGWLKRAWLWGVYPDETVN